MDLVQVPPIDIAAGDFVFRAVLDDASVADGARAAFADSLSRQPGTLALILEAPSDDNGLYRLLDRSGITVARAREASALIGSAIAHLASLLAAAAGPAQGQVLVKLRALAHADGSASLLTPPFGINPTLAERRLHKEGLALVDHAVLTIDADGAIQPTVSAAVTATPGHVRLSEALPVQHIVTAAGGGPEATAPATIAANAAAVSVGQRHDVFAAAIGLAQRSVVTLDHTDTAALYKALS